MNKSVSEFSRGLKPDFKEKLLALTLDTQQNWWKDLLSLWRPSGAKAGDYGLRLAIRQDYLNFYWRGQSIANVSMSEAGVPCAKTHLKYAIESAPNTQQYVRLTGRELVTCGRQGSILPVGYTGIETLLYWIRNAGEHVGREKEQVELVVASNAMVVDLEMAVTVIDKGKRVAKRIDFVALEPDAAGYRLAFWEVKLIDDPRIKSRRAPEVLEQLKFYRDYLTEHESAVKVAYRTTCNDLVSLFNMVNQSSSQDSSSIALDPAVHAVANGAPLRVDIVPRLLIIGGAKSSAWVPHRDKLNASGLTMREVATGDMAILDRPLV